MKQAKRETRGLCPLAGFAQCRGERCALWDDHWALCSLSSGSRYSGIRAAACDAAVEVMGATSQVMMFGGGRGSPIEPAKAGPLLHEPTGPHLSENSPPDCFPGARCHCGGEALGEAGA